MRFLALTALLLTLAPAQAHDIMVANADWYKNQRVNPAAKARMGLGFWSCCDAGDHFQTRFRLIEDGTRYGTETYQYWKDDAWHNIPPDIIQHKPTPDGRPVLFIVKSSGKAVCFIIDKEGI